MKIKDYPMKNSVLIKPYYSTEFITFNDLDESMLDWEIVYKYTESILGKPVRVLVIKNDTE